MDFSPPNIALSPNPSSNTLNINFENQTHLASIQISDITGRVLQSFNIQNSTSNISINVSSLSSGMYFLRITSSNKTETKKFIKE